MTLYEMTLHEYVTDYYVHVQYMYICVSKWGAVVAR